MYETARTDLLALERLGLLRAEKIGRRWHFSPVVNLAFKLAGE